MDWHEHELPQTVARLAERGGEGRVRTLVADLLRYGLGVRDLDHEFRVPEVRGRIDALFGATVFEFKSDLRRERHDAEQQLQRYLAERERATGQRWTGVATDGATFTAYELRQGVLAQLDEHSVRPDAGRALLDWLDAIVAVRVDLPAEPLLIRREPDNECVDPCLLNCLAHRPNIINDHKYIQSQHEKGI